MIILIILFYLIIPTPTITTTDVDGGGGEGGNFYYMSDMEMTSPVVGPFDSVVEAVDFIKECDSEESLSESTELTKLPSTSRATLCINMYGRIHKISIDSSGGKC